MRTLVEIAQELASASDEIDAIRLGLRVDERYYLEREDVDAALKRAAADLETIGQHVGEIGRGHDA